MSSLVGNPGWMVLLRAAIAGAGVLILISFALRPAGAPGERRRWRDGLLLALGLAAGLSWWDPGAIRAVGFVHVWDAYHHYMGAKYFKELGYERLYLCAVLADEEDGRLDAGAIRRIRDLASNTLVSAAAALRDPGRCRSHFSSGRWAAFKHDLAWFRGRMSARNWAAAQGDHGYNASPAWGILGTLLASLSPASTPQLLALALLDPLLLVAMWACVAWAFGWRVMCVALLYWGTNFPGASSWQAGAILRQDWLAASVVGICLLRRGWMATAGAALMVATLLRVFPAFILAGLLLKVLSDRIAEKSWVLSVAERRILAGSLLALALLVPTGALVAGSWRAWPDFAVNSVKHAATPLTNHMGLKTVMAFEPGSRATVSAPLALEVDPFAVWKDARRRVFAERRWLWGGLVAAFIVVLALAVRGQPAWVAATLGVGLIPIGGELTCYYYAVLLAYGLLWREEDVTGIGLVILSAATSLAPALSAWDDVRYTMLSAAVVGFVIIVTACHAFRVRRIY